MHITAFWAQGYRSLADVHLDNLGPFNVFYGPNGAGKSSILAAMRTLFGLLAWRSAPSKSFEGSSSAGGFDGSATILHPRDRSHFRPDQPMVLGARVAPSNRDELDASWPFGLQLMCEVTYDWFKRDLTISHLEWVPRGMNVEIMRSLPEPVLEPSMQPLVYRIAERIYSLIDADRVPRAESLVSSESEVGDILAAGKLKEGLFRASTHPDPLVRRRFKQLQQLLQGPPLHRPSFELVHDARNNAVELVESTSAPVQQPSEVPLDLAGLGVAQIYSILGQALLRNADVVAIEDPEAHLHAPSSGVHLRELLERLVTENYLDQLFIATHGNFFDLDPTGYYNVSLDEQGATRVERKPLQP